MAYDYSSYIITRLPRPKANRLIMLLLFNNYPLGTGSGVQELILQR